MFFSDIIDFIASIFTVYPCVFCDRDTRIGALWCGKCRYITAGKVNNRFSDSYKDALAAIVYDNNTRKAIYRLKDDGDRRAARFLAQHMQREMAEHWKGISFDLIIPVPMNHNKETDKGFNQAALLALQLSRLAGIPMETGIMARHEGMQEQHTLNAVQRRENAEKSYVVNKPEAVNGKILLLVDDVMTTGATLDICARRLLDSGAKAVYVIAAAKVGLDRK